MRRRRERPRRAIRGHRVHARAGRHHRRAALEQHASHDEVGADAEEEEMVDPLEVVREQCNANANGKALAAELKKCTERVEADEETEETCTEWCNMI